MLKYEYKNVVILSILNLIPTGFLAINYDFSVGMIYFGFSLAGVILYSLWDSFDIGDAIGIDNLNKDILLGVVVGAIFAFSAVTNPAFSIGLPKSFLALDTSNEFKFILVGLVAPITEEIFFRGIILSVIKSITSNNVVSMISSAILFSVYHYNAYGVAMSASYISAGVFGLLAAFLAFNTKNIMPSVIMHSMANISTYITRASTYMFV